MKKKMTEHICEAFIAAARPTAALFAGFALLSILGTAGKMPVWRHVFRWDTFFILSFFGYAIFIVLPLRQFSNCKFFIATAIGLILALGSISMSIEMYDGVVNYLLGGNIYSHIMAWILLIPIYLYIPMTIWKRKQEQQKSEHDDTC